jgi:nitrogen fixation protein FixH
MIGSITYLFRNDRWIPASFVGFFIFLTCVEIVLITLAVNSFTGLSEADPYRRGLGYNEMLKARQKDRDLGWRVSVGFAQDGRLNGIVNVAARGANGAELSGVRVSGTAENGGRAPVAIKFSPLHDGNAEGQLQVDTPGRWFLRIAIEGDDASIERKREIFIEPK